MQYKCETCTHFYYDHFCSYEASCCKIHGIIDCNPDSYLKTLKEDEDCLDYKEKNKQVILYYDESEVNLTTINNLYSFLTDNITDKEIRLLPIESKIVDLMILN